MAISFGKWPNGILPIVSLKMNQFLDTYLMQHPSNPQNMLKHSTFSINLPIRTYNLSKKNLTFEKIMTRKLNKLIFTLAILTAHNSYANTDFAEMQRLRGSDRPGPTHETDPEDIAGGKEQSTWSDCYNHNNATIEDFRNCVITAKEDLKASNNRIEFTAATQASATCQKVFQESTGVNSWSQISKDIYNNGISDAIKDYDGLVARFIIENNSKLSSPEEVSTDDIGRAVKKVTACAQLAAAYGENLEAGRDEDEPYYDPSKLTSMDGRITCKLSGLETIDYDECASLVLAHNGAELGQVANTTFQQYEAQSLNSKQQQELMNLDGSENVTTAALKAQKDGLAAQQDMAEQRRALQTTRLALIGTLSYKIPTSNEYFEDEQLCTRPVQSALEKISTTIKDFMGGASDPTTLCKDNFRTEKFGFFRNAEAKRIGNVIAAEAGVDVAAETMAVSQLGKQKSMISSAIGKIEGMDTLELPEDFYTNEDAYMQFCTINPTHAECQSSYGSTVNVPTFGDYNVGGFGTNQAYQESSSDTTAATTAASTADPVAANVDTSTAVTKGEAGGGLKGNFGPGATVTEGGQIAQGAGGGGSSPGGGGGGGGSSAGDAGAQPAGTTAASGGTEGLSYVGGSGPSFVGGRGIASKKSSSKSSNPFENMFGKSKNRDLSSLNYNGNTAIGSKTDNLFQRISSAYDKANNSGNLLKYETKSIE